MEVMDTKDVAICKSILDGIIGSIIGLIMVLAPTVVVLEGSGATNQWKSIQSLDLSVNSKK